MIPLIEETTLKFGWASEELLLQFIGIAEITPGPFAINMATFVGSTTAGVLGSVCATAGVVFPSLIIITTIALVAKKIKKGKRLDYIFDGINPIVISLILSTSAIFFIECLFFSYGKIGSEFSFDLNALIIILSACIFMFVVKKISKKNVSPILVIVFSAILGMILYGLN